MILEQLEWVSVCATGAREDRIVSGRAWLLAILTVGASLAAWWILVGKPGGETNPENTGLRDPTTTELPAEVESPATVAADQPTPVVPTAEAVLADPQCRMVVGQRTASDTALVYVPLGDGAWFAVVNTFGVVFDGTLPSVPERAVVGKRPDGTILAGFGFEGEVRIVHDGSVIYEFDDVWSFDIAADGSSFFVVEPLAGDASRLVVRNLELREEHHFDLGTAVERRGRRLSADLTYSGGFAEVSVRPSRGKVRSNRFYPVHGGDHRQVDVEYANNGDVAVFESSDVSYHAYYQGDRRGSAFRYIWRVVKVQRDFDGGAKRANEAWGLDLTAIGPLSMQLSADGAWLVVSGFVTVHVFDTADGASVFTRANMDTGYRVSDRVPAISPHRDRRGRTQRLSARFVGNRLFVRGWTDGNPDVGVVEKFDLARNSGARSIESLEVGKATGESEQTFTLRTVLDPGSPTACTDHTILDRRILIRDGRLAYRRDAG